MDGVRRGEIQKLLVLETLPKPPRAIGTSASPLMEKLDSRHYEVLLSPHERVR
jgi:hypothetical protein